MQVGEISIKRSQILAMTIFFSLCLSYYFLLFDQSAFFCLAFPLITASLFSKFIHHRKQGKRTHERTKQTDKIEIKR